MDTLRAVLVPVNAECREIELPIDGNGNCGEALKDLLGERVANVSQKLPDKSLGEAVCVYVNAGGSSACPANRAIWGTQEMADEGRESPLTGQTVVAGEPADVLYGDVVIVGYDPYEGLECSLSDTECRDIKDLFSGRGGPYSGVSALGLAQSKELSSSATRGTRRLSTTSASMRRTATYTTTTGRTPTTIRSGSHGSRELRAGRVRGGIHERSRQGCI